MNRYGGFLVLGILLFIFGGILFWSVSQPDSEVEESYPMDLIFSVGEDLGWSAVRVTSPTVIEDADAGITKMWYVGNGVADRSGIGYATKRDAQGWEVETIEDPIMGIGADWEDGGIRSAHVVKENVYKMWYSADELYGEETSRIGYATSSTGTSWAKIPSNPIVEPVAGSWMAHSVDDPTVVKVLDTYHMWFSGTAELDGPRAIGHATSRDGINWTVDPEPVFSGYQDWDRYSVYDPYVIYENGLFEMWFVGKGKEKGLTAIGRAFSDNGTAWVEDHINNPFIGNRKVSIEEPFFIKGEKRYGIYASVLTRPNHDEEMFEAEWRDYRL